MADHVAPRGVAREPAALIGGVTTAVTSVLALLVAFGVDLTDDQQKAILGVIAGAGPLVAALLIRPRVAPESTVVARTRADGETVTGAGATIPAGVEIDGQVRIGTITPR